MSKSESAILNNVFGLVAQVCRPRKLVMRGIRNMNGPMTDEKRSAQMAWFVEQLGPGLQAVRDVADTLPAEEREVYLREAAEGISATLNRRMAVINHDQLDEYRLELLASDQRLAITNALLGGSPPNAQR
jgi:hypothetical protein